MLRISNDGYAVKASRISSAELALPKPSPFSNMFAILVLTILQQPPPFLHTLRTLSFSMAFAWRQLCPPSR